MSRHSFRCWRREGPVIVPHRSGVPLSDRGFRYGEHLFESLAVRKGTVLLADDHLSLLGEAASRNGIPFPGNVATPLRNFLATTKLPDGMLRIYLTAGPGAPGVPVNEPGLFLSWEKTPFPSRLDLKAGFRLVTARGTRAGSSWREKSGNYLPHLGALSEARQAGADEAVVLDAKGVAVSCAMANLLVWLPSSRGLTLCTPGKGGRSGAVLRWVEKNLEMKRRMITTADLKRARALAVTNSRLGVMPVTSLDGRRLPDSSPAHHLASEYLRVHGLLRGS
jgi:branched-subunit amino acid aminotransferase/4-amino-4-deoxychorismate lyase